MNPNETAIVPPPVYLASSSTEVLDKVQINYRTVLLAASYHLPRFTETYKLNYRIEAISHVIDAHW